MIIKLHPAEREDGAESDPRNNLLIKHLTPYRKGVYFLILIIYFVGYTDLRRSIQIFSQQRFLSERSKCLTTLRKKSNTLKCP